jgi:ABC-2 type transport system ATP-binding protein
MLKGIGLADRANEPVKNYSGGMKRRFNTGCALMQDPILIIMDEPTVGIDPQSRNYIYLIIEKLIKKAKRSSIPAITWKKCRT